MKSKWATKLAIWLGTITFLTALAIIIWQTVSGGSQSTESLKWLQLLQTIGTFLLPPVLCAWIWDEHHTPFRWLGLRSSANWQTIVLATLAMVCAIPAINLLADLNSRVELPKSLEFIEQILKAQEEAAAELTERFLAADNLLTLLLNIGLLALLPALAEELSFRGTLQQIISPVSGPSQGTVSVRTHVAIWVTAFIFSAVHLQFYGFVPRMLMGAMFGYVFVWTGSLWVPMVMHFTNNGIAVLAYYLIGPEGQEKSWADTIGAGSTWWLGVISLIGVCCLLYWIRVRGLQGYARRIRKQ